MGDALKITNLWKFASQELGFSFASPYTIEIDGRQVECIGLAPDFGSVKGMVLFVGDAASIYAWTAAAQKGGFGFSQQSFSFLSYDREFFIETLNDWGWVPIDRPPPPWYTGEPWDD